MSKFTRIALAFVVLLSGVALVPVMGLPSYGFSWQRYANVYEPVELEIDHGSGAPGSFFTVSGFNFDPETTASVMINGVEVGTLETDAMGSFQFTIDTAAGEEGYYTVLVSSGFSRSKHFRLVESGNLWLPGEPETVFILPAQIAQQWLFMPYFHR